MATFPTDKDIYTSNDKLIRQTDCQYTFGMEAVTLSLKFMGDTDTAIALASSFREGTRVKLSDVKAKFGELGDLDASTIEASGKVVTSQAVTQQGSTNVTVTVKIPFKSKLSPNSDEPEDRKVVTWSEKSTDYEFPLEIYAGDVSSSSTEYANAGDFQAWKNEKDKNIENYKSFQYDVEGEDEPVELEARTKDLAEKVYKGIESVRRAYPEVIRTTRYYNYKADADTVDNTLINKIDEDPDLYEIDSTPSTIWASKFPNYSWLKASYDVECEATEYAKFWNITVTESWIGIDPTERGAWDNNLYGTGNNRWKFAQADGGSNNNNS